MVFCKAQYGELSCEKQLLMGQRKKTRYWKRTYKNPWGYTKVPRGRGTGGGGKNGGPNGATVSGSQLPHEETEKRCEKDPCTN